jgi:hypothetical protein
VPKDGTVGDLYQTIVDRDVTSDVAGGLGQRVVGDLIRRGVVTGKRSGCVLGGSGMGYPPGPNAEAVVVPHVHTEACRNLPHADFRRDRTNGLDVEVGRRRRVYYSMTGEQALVCRRCGTRLDVDTFPPALDMAVNEWAAQTGEGRFVCPRCGVGDLISEWRWDPPWGFGCLGLTFWNWPWLRDSFVQDLSALLGHRTVRVYGKL